MARIREFEASFEQGVEGFLRIYPHYIEQVKPELNGLFREEDYPVAEKLRTKFGLKVEILPIPTGADFRVQMSAEEQARVSREIDASVRESPTRGTEDLWRRVREAVARMVDRLNEPESRFHGSLVTNVLDIVEILPRLNVNGDADLKPLRGPDQTAALQLLCAGPQETRSPARHYGGRRCQHCRPDGRRIARPGSGGNRSWPDRRRHLHAHVSVHVCARGRMRIDVTLRIRWQGFEAYDGSAFRLNPL
jgi:hypothetical protein